MGRAALSSSKLAARSLWWQATPERRPAQPHLHRRRPTLHSLQTTRCSGRGGKGGDSSDPVPAWPRYMAGRAAVSGRRERGAHAPAGMKPLEPVTSDCTSTQPSRSAEDSSARVSPHTMDAMVPSGEALAARVKVFCQNGAVSQSSAKRQPLLRAWHAAPDPAVAAMRARPAAASAPGSRTQQRHKLARDDAELALLLGVEVVEHAQPRHRRARPCRGREAESWGAAPSRALCFGALVGAVVTGADRPAAVIPHKWCCSLRLRLRIAKQ
jgi:hypothetical protein